MSSEALRLADAITDYCRFGFETEDQAKLRRMAAHKEAASLLRTQAARIAELEAELTEQARIVGMGAERELALIAERDQLRAEVERLRKPLTDEQIKAACSDIYLSDYPQGSASYDIALARAIEAAKEAK